MDDYKCNGVNIVIGAISLLQRKALQIMPPPESNCLPAKGGLSGPAFFPEGLGLSELHLLRGSEMPRIIAVGHNFGCVDYRAAIELVGREDDKPTWRNLDRILSKAGICPESCFRTNWFIGLLLGSSQMGKFLRAPDKSYEVQCNRILIDQISLIKPRVLLLLGPEVASRAYQIAPTLAPWRGAKRWIDIDHSSIGPSPRDVEIPGAGLRVNVTAILHPSFGAANEGRRMRNMSQPITEAELIRAAIID
ncbi:MAG: hypothetical protein P4L03_02755 [Terracidiphilus sp.]|nr:hypothetical protein [Terracidiphilus sp.]